MTLLAAGGTATATANTRAARLVFNASFTIAAGHFLRWYCSTTNGTGNWGAGPDAAPAAVGHVHPPVSAVRPRFGSDHRDRRRAVTLTQALTTGAAEMLYVDTGNAVPIGGRRAGRSSSR
jgi:hypothetical protein